jgi:trk system potassium uptake protein TrkH
MNSKMIVYVLGKVLLIGALLLCLPLLTALVYGESLLPFLTPIAALAATGGLLGAKQPKCTVIYAKEGFFIVALSWLSLSVFGALPFYLMGEGLSFLDCLFETVSGFTTTGASIFPAVEHLSRGILFWRSFTHWVGGMGVLVFVLAVLPQTDSHALHLMRAEVPGPQVGKLVSKLKFTVRILYGIYFVITLAEILLLALGGMPLFDSIVNAFATAGTGGFSVRNSSIAAYGSAYIDMVISLFMILFGINFNLFYFLLAGQALQTFKSQELRVYLSIIALATAGIAFNIRHLYHSPLQSLRYAFFQVSSIITTTGFSTADFNQWPGFSQAVLVLLMFLGACAGSTGGGMKISRLIILFQTTVAEMRHLISPRSVRVIKLEGRALTDDVLRGVGAFFAALMMLTGAAVLVLAFEGLDLISAFTAVAACINNVGPGLAAVGPMGNYGSLASVSKGVLILSMLAGRLELFPILLLFSPSAWKGR